MDASSIYLTIAVIAGLLALYLVFFARRRQTPSRLTPLAAVAFALVIAGVVFGENRLLGYSLMGAGVLLALYDAGVKARQ